MTERLRRALRTPWVGPLVALLAVYLLFFILRPDTFARTANLVTMARQTVVVGIATVGMTLIIVHGGIDLSVGSAVALTSVIVAKLLKDGHSPMMACGTAVLAATACGAINGALIARGRLLPFIVTLGTMSALRGAAKGLANEQKIDAPAHGLDALLAPLPPNRSWMLVPPGVWIAIGIAILFAWILRATRFGRHVYAVGSNEQTARLCGVRVERVKVSVYAIAGLLAGVAGIMSFSNLTVGDPTTSVGLELDVIAAVVIGGGSLSGGEGSILGAIFGACLMTVVKTGSTFVGLPNWVQEILTGGIIIAAAGLDRLRQRAR